MIGPRAIGERLEALGALDCLADPAQRAARRVLPQGPVKDGLDGVWLGHPLHPLLTDLPIGFWTSAFVLDLVGGRPVRPAADALVGLGVAAATPTAASRLADWSELNRPEGRSGAVHAIANLAATVLYGLSLVARRGNRRAAGVGLGVAGAAAATVGGFLGGHLTFRRAVGVNQTAALPATSEWAVLHVVGVTNIDKPAFADVDGTRSPSTSARVSRTGCMSAAATSAVLSTKATLSTGACVVRGMAAPSAPPMARWFAVQPPHPSRSTTSASTATATKPGAAGCPPPVSREPIS